MFSGIVTDVGRVTAVERGGGDARFVIETGYDAAAVAVGASIAHCGVCLTVVQTGAGHHAVDVSAETLSRTTLGGWAVGTDVNLERSLRMGDEIGGHLVFGHVDGLATVVSRRPEGDSQRFVFAVSADLGRFVAVKGSIALDGVSLTVNEVTGGPDGTTRFGVNIIPHTLQCTTFGTLTAGRQVNVEADMLARYVARLLETRA